VTRSLVATAKQHGLMVTFHRAFDTLTNPLSALEKLISLGVDRILTAGTPWQSGQSAVDGLNQLNTYLAHSANQIEIVMGGGVTLENAEATQSHPLYQHIKRLNMIRSDAPALDKAPMSEVNEWGAGMSFVRDLSSEGSYAVVGLAAGGNQQINVSNVQNGTYTDAVSGETKQVSGGSFTFNVPAHSVRVWVLNGGGQIGSSGKYLK